MNLFRLKLWICEMNSFMLKLWICEMNHLYSNPAFGTRTLFILNFCTDFYSYTYVFFLFKFGQMAVYTSCSCRQAAGGRPAGRPASLVCCVRCRPAICQFATHEAHEAGQHKHRTCFPFGSFFLAEG